MHGRCTAGQHATLTVILQSPWSDVWGVTPACDFDELLNLVSRSFLILKAETETCRAL